ncbi:hypothetical protein GCM10009557_21090 [Virgisporangium ochraceum]|uniref:Uncharacterized protein n=1 Tax=Virgisporangium ochraceum TaxID=65505 RepID=A0A8J3ZQQ4_9ACTN|nr:hypothetical protein [Virgisporangium ochraceum]GIJ66555.1 hypothetical protein Voc01_014720 [Virgisporangium ochraceum]
MRTRRIAIGCRRTGTASTVAIAPSGSSDPAMEAMEAMEAVEAQPVDLAWPPQLEPWIRHVDPLPARVPGTARSGGPAIPTPAPPPPDERDLTLADLTSQRRDLAWNDNPGWPVGLDWTTIARAARGHSPRHARRRLGPLPRRVFTWTSAGVLTAILLTILVTTIAEIVH